MSQWPLPQPARFRATNPRFFLASKDTASWSFWRNCVLAALVASVESLACTALSWAHRLEQVQRRPQRRSKVILTTNKGP